MPRLYNFKKNAYEEVPQEHVKRLVLSREYAFNQIERVPVIAPDGSRHMIPGAEALEAMEKGGEYGSTSDWDRLARKEKYGTDTAEGYAGAALSGLARGATLGVSDAFLNEFIEKDRLKHWREEYSGTSTAAEIGGAMLPAFFSGGTSSAVSGGKLVARLAPSSLAFKGGRALEQTLANSAVLSRGADKGLALKILSSTLPKAAGGALEGAAFGAGTTLTEASLGDPDEAAEMLWSNIGYSALFGGMANAGVHATMVGVPGGAKKMSDGFASLYEKATNSKMSVKAQDKLLDLTGGLLGVESETLKKQVGLYRGAKEARAGAIAKEATFRKSQDDIVTNLNTVLDDLGTVAQNSRGGNKREHMRKQLFNEPAENVDEFRLANYSNTQVKSDLETRAAMAHRGILAARETIETVYGDLHTLGQAMRETGGYAWKAGGRELRGHAKTLMDVLNGKAKPEHLEKMLRQWDELVTPKVRAATSENQWKAIIEAGEDTFLLLDDYKKYLGHWAFGKKGRNVLQWNTQGALAKSENKIRKLLENKILWGQAAETQATINPKFSRFISAIDDFKTEFGDRISKGKNKWQDEWINTQKVGKFLKNLEGRGDNTMQASWGVETEKRFHEFFAAADDFSTSANKLYGFEGDAALSAGRVSSTLRSTKTNIDEMIQSMRETRFINEAAGGNGFHPRYAAQLYRRFGYGAFGGLTFGPVGAAAGFIMGGLADGAATARKLAMMEHNISNARKVMNTSLDKIVDRMTKGGPGGSIPVRPNRTKLFLAPLAAQFGEEESKKKTTKMEDYKKAKERAMKLQDPEALMGAIDKITGPIEHDMPNLSASLKAKGLAGMHHAMEGFNKDSRTIDDKIMGVPERQPTDRELAQQEIRFAVLEDPIGETLGNFEAGTLTSTHVDMLEKTYPNIYGSIVAGLLERFSLFSDDSDTRVHHAYRNQASILFKRPFDVSHKPENINILQSSYAKKEEGTKIKSTPLLKTMGAFGPSEVEKIAMG